MNYDDLKLHDPDDFFSLLLHTGYLTAVDNPSKNNYLAKIPNKEILECFNSNITECFNDMVKEGPDFKAVNIAKFLLKGDEKKVEDLLSEVILTYVSTSDFATKSNPENFYQSFFFRNIRKLLRCNFRLQVKCRSRFRISGFCF